MKIWIEHPTQPVMLILAWQAPDEFRDEDRRRWEVGAIYQSDDQVMFRYFGEPEFGHRNFGRTLQKLRDYGFEGYPAFKFEPDRTFDKDVIETFNRRLPPKSRADFGRYLDYFSIPPEADLSAFQLLGITEARLPGDGFSLIDPLDPEMETGEVAFEIAGYRHESPDLAPAVGQHLTLEAEPTNTWDENAVAVYIGTSRIGFVNKIQAPVVCNWLDSREIECRLLRYNGRQGAPRAYALLRIAARNGRLAA